MKISKQAAKFIIHSLSPRSLLLLITLLSVNYTIIFLNFTTKPSIKTDTKFEPQNLFWSWQNNRETCKQWISAQKVSRSYLDAYIIGVQKGATTELSMRIDKLGVSPRLRRSVKEWHFFEKLPDIGDTQKLTHLHLPYVGDDLSQLRLDHYKSGFPNETNVTFNTIPMIDDSDRRKRTLTYDATVEYMLSDRVSFLAHSITPHAKIIMTFRNPLDRALSQYNMMIRIYNQAYRKSGKKQIPATASQFHKISKTEMDRIKSCGYDPNDAKLVSSTSDLLNCVLDVKTKQFDKLLYVTRGIYHIHIDTWRNYFPDHRIHYISFSDISEGKREAMNDLSDFLCIRRFPPGILKSFEENGSSQSFGQRAAKDGLKKLGFESYEGKDKYLTKLYPKTIKMYKEFFKVPNSKLEAMMGRKLF